MPVPHLGVFNRGKVNKMEFTDFYSSCKYDYDEEMDYGVVLIDTLWAEDVDESQLSSSQRAEAQYWKRLNYLFTFQFGPEFKEKIVAHYPRRREVIIELPYGRKVVRKRVKVDETLMASHLQVIIDYGRTYTYPKD